MFNFEKMSFKSRVVFSFLFVPWLPVLFLLPYSFALPRPRTMDWGSVTSLLFLCVVLAAFTYILEAILLIPIWRLMLSAGKLSVFGFAFVGFVVAFVTSFLAIGFLLGPGFFFEGYLLVLVPLFSFIGCAEAVVFWLIVRPDRHVSSIKTDTTKTS